MGAAFMISFLLLAFIVPIVQLVLGIRSAVMKKTWIAQAVQSGHFVIAELNAFRNGAVGHDEPIWDSAEYHYEADGKTYKYSLQTSSPPDKLTLYYKKNPKHAQAEKEFGNTLRDQILTSATVWLVIFLLLCLLFSL